jgi:hypothetical protein
MKLSLISKKLLPALALLLATAAFAATKSSLELSDPVTVGGHQLAPGEYQIKWEGAGPNIDLNILSKGKVVATVPAHVVPQDRAGANDTYRTSKGGDGSLSLTEIHFAGKKYSLSLSDDATTATQKDSKSNSSSN